MVDRYFMGQLHPAQSQQPMPTADRYRMAMLPPALLPGH
jgi:hypothetical protein